MPDHADCKELITFAEAARRLERSIRTLYDWSSRGLIEEARLGRGRGTLLCWPCLLRSIARTHKTGRAASSQTLSQ